MLLVHHACYSLFLQTATVCSQHTCIILLHQTDTAKIDFKTVNTVLLHVNFYGMNLLTVFVIIDFSTVGDVCAKVTWFDGCHKPRFLEEI